MILLAIIGIIILIIGSTVYSSLSWGLVMLYFYQWFIMPIFTMMPEINYWQAVGLVIFTSLLKASQTDSIKDEYKNSYTPIITMLAGPWITLLLGYMIYSWFII